MTSLRWIASSSSSALATAAALARQQPAADRRLAEAIAGPARHLAETVQAARLALPMFFAQAVPLAASIENNRELAGLVVRRVTGERPGEQLVSELAAAIGALEEAFRHALPGAADELELRSGPLREQWEARGPGLLAAIGRATDARLLVERADVLVVSAVSGGGGEAYLPYNSVSIEAVLANPHADLPEVARLAWLISTLQFDVPEFGEGIAPARLGQLAGWAMLPAALQGAEYVELVRDAPHTLARAIVAWGLVEPGSADRATLLAGTVTTWWQTLNESPTRWPVSLRALDEMLAASGV